MSVERWEDEARRCFVYSHNPRPGACPVPYFRRCPCCGCDVMDDLTGSGAKAGQCCNLCHPSGVCAQCRAGSRPGEGQ